MSAVNGKERKADCGAERSGRSTKRSRRNDVDPEAIAEMQRKREQIRLGETLWKSGKCTGLFQAYLIGEEVLGGNVMQQYKFIVKGYKAKLQNGDPNKVLAIEGETVFSGYDALYRETLCFDDNGLPLLDDQGNHKSDDGAKLIKNAQERIERLNGRESQPSSLGNETPHADTTTRSNDTPIPGTSNMTTVTPQPHAEALASPVRNYVDGIANYYKQGADERCASLSAKNDELKSKVQDLQTELSLTNSEKNTFKSQLSNVSKANKELSTKNKTLTTKNTNLATKVKELKKQLQDEKTSYFTAQKKLADELSDYQKKLADEKAAREQDSLRYKREINSCKTHGGEGHDGDENANDKAKLRDEIMRAVVTEKPNVTWEDVAGLEKAKEILAEVSLFFYVYATTNHSIALKYTFLVSF